MSKPLQTGIAAALLALVIACFEFSDIDVHLQDVFYRQDAGTWLVGRTDAVPRAMFYTGPKAVLIAFGACCVLGWALSFRLARLRPTRRFCGLMVLALAVVPGTISIGKHTTNVYTPAKTVRYGGKRPYVKLCERYPAGYRQDKPGRGFPAGHASGGFALMMLFFAFERWRNRSIGLATGLIAGWAMGLYQMMRGAHYLSHTVVSMMLAWILILLIVWGVDAATRRLWPLSGETNASCLPAEAGPETRSL